MQSMSHWLVILAVLVLLFGGRGRVSSVMSDIGRGLRAFKDHLDGSSDSDNKSNFI